MSQHIWSHFQKTYNNLIIEPNFITVVYDKVACVPLIESQKNERNHWNSSLS